MVAPMRRLLVGLILLAALVNAVRADWVEGSVVGAFKRDGLPPLVVSYNYPRGEWDEPKVVWPLNFETYPIFPEGVRSFWVTVDVSKLVPVDTKAIYLEGQVIVTPRASREELTCYMNVELRESGSKAVANGIYAVDTISPYGGPRTNIFTLMTIRDGKFQARVYQSSWQQWPDGCAFGFNLRLVGYVR